MKINETIATVLLACAMLFTLSACDDKGGGLEEAGEEIDEAFEDAGEAIEDAGEAIEDAIE